MGSEACSERCVQEVTTVILNWPQPDAQIFISQLSLFRHLGWYVREVFWITIFIKPYSVSILGPQIYLWDLRVPNRRL